MSEVNEIMKLYKSLNRRRRLVAEIMLYAFAFSEKKDYVKVNRLRDTQNKNKWIYQIEVNLDD